MNTPFKFGKIVKGKDFTNRIQETRQLISNFEYNVNTIIVSPRRWGKSSLVEKAAITMKRKDSSIRFCFIDLYNIRSEEEFYRVFAENILQSTSSKLDDMLIKAKKLLKKFLPIISINPDHTNEISLSLNWAEVKKKPDEILNLPENIADTYNLKIIVCIDEFQNIASFTDPLFFQKKLRANWQKHVHTAYCLYGSKRHMMMEVFSSPSMPFYNFGEVMFLEKINSPDWIKFIVKQFSASQKKISTQTAGYIAELAGNHPYYVQQLAFHSWLTTKNQCDNRIVDIALTTILLQFDMIFQALTDTLTSTQVNFLKALIAGVTQFSSTKTIKEFQLGTSANVNRIKTALVQKEIIDIFNEKMEILDPMFGHWLKSIYFKIG